MGERESVCEHAAPRPWFVIGPPWNRYEPWVNSASDDPHAGQFVCDLDGPAGDPALDQSFGRKMANAELIVRAVNEYDALRELEDALRAHHPAPARGTLMGCETCAALKKLDDLRSSLGVTEEASHA